jgi:hypothetical protein
MLLAMILYALVAVWLDWYVYDFSADGVAVRKSGGSAPNTVRNRFLFFFARRSKSATAYFLANPITALLLVSGSESGIRDSYDAASSSAKWRLQLPRVCAKYFHDLRRG